MIDAMIHFVPLITASAVVISLVVAVVQIVYVNRRQRQQTARTIYFEYLKRSMDNPLFAYPARFAEKYDLGGQEIDGSKEKFEQYEWHIGLLVAVAREILESMGDDAYWEKTILRNLRYHKDYLLLRRQLNKKDDFIHTAGRKVIRMINDVIDEVVA